MKPKPEEDKDDIIAALRAEINTLKNVLWMMPGHVYWRDTDGKYLGCNANVAKLFNLASPDDIVGKNHLEVLETRFSNQTNHANSAGLVELANKTNNADLTVLANQEEIYIEESAHA